MKIFNRFAWAALALVALGLFAAPTAQAGTRVSINIGGGGYYPPAYYPRPAVYYPQPYYARPVYYQPAYCPPPRGYGYYPNQGYRPYPGNYGYGYARPVYYNPGCR